MRIDINEKYCITSDEYQYILNTKFVSNGKKTKGQEELKAVAYCSDLNHCLKELVKRQIRESDCTSLRDVVKRIEEIRSEINRTINF
ncbi:MAG: DUF5405 family protein [Desulfitobacterium hafniense]|uniref:DUF5405 family protein n=1 Tax=Desulfitobacterium hafniense TaxID=49338 RepID=UPI000361C40B|nr:DUF5405 family protein [Desulfitobacterium hafniense]